MRRIQHAWPILVLLVISGCASVSRHMPDWLAPDAAIVRHESVHDAATVARMRAAPPGEPEVAVGAGFVSDQSDAATRGEVRIGNAFFNDDANATDHALELARELGADRVLLYREDAARAAGAQAGELAAAYYVQFRLLFGATFRDLTTRERDSLRAGGVQIGAVINDTPAALANLMPGDIILAVDGQQIADKQQFQRSLSSNQGDAVTMKVWRNGEAIDRIVTLGAAPQP